MKRKPKKLSSSLCMGNQVAVVLKGKLATAAEYLEIVAKKIKPEMTDEIYKYLSFDKVTKEEVVGVVQ